MSAALSIGPSYANKSNTRFVDKITDESTAPPQYDNLPLLRKYFGNTTPADYSAMPAEDKKEILRMLNARKDSLVATLNVLKQTSTISLKNASMANKIQHMNELMDEIRSGSTIVNSKAAAGAAATAAGAAAVAVSPPTPAPSPAPRLVDATFAAAYILLQRIIPDISAATSIQNWNSVKEQQSALTLKDAIDGIAGSNPDTLDTPINAAAYLIKAHLASTLLAPPTNKETSAVYKKKFVPIFEPLKGVIDGMDKNLDVVTALSSSAATPPAASTTAAFLNTLFTTDPSTYSPPTTLPDALSVLPVPPTTTYDEIVYYTCYLLLQQFIAENK